MAPVKPMNVLFFVVFFIDCSLAAVRLCFNRLLEMCVFLALIVCPYFSLFFQPFSRNSSNFSWSTIDTALLLLISLGFTNKIWISQLFVILRTCTINLKSVCKPFALNRIPRLFWIHSQINCLAKFSCLIWYYSHDK